MIRGTSAADVPRIISRPVLDAACATWYNPEHNPLTPFFGQAGFLATVQANRLITVSGSLFGNENLIALC